MQRLLAPFVRLIRRSPILYFLLCGWKPAVRRLRASPASDLVVEAFPRSANTTSMYAFFYAQKESVKVGHHLHVPAHVAYAVKQQIPCLVIMRRPIDCVASLMVMRKGGDPVVLLKDYIDFAKVARRHRNHIVIADFDGVAADGIGLSIRLVNQRFGTHFAEPTNSPDEIAWVQEQVRRWNEKYSGGDVEKLSFPTEAKKAKAEDMRKRIVMHEELLSEANAIYNELTGS